MLLAAATNTINVTNATTIYHFHWYIYILIAVVFFNSAVFLFEKLYYYMNIKRNRKCEWIEPSTFHFSRQYERTYQNIWWMHPCGALQVQINVIVSGNAHYYPKTTALSIHFCFVWQNNIYSTGAIKTDNECAGCEWWIE